MEMVYYQLGKSSYNDLLKELEADIQHANALVASIPKPKGGGSLHMKLVYNQFSPMLFLLLQWLDGSCSCFFPHYFNIFHILIYEVYPDGRTRKSMQGSKATVRDFYAIILPSLRRLYNDLVEQESSNTLTKRSDEKEKLIGHGRLQSTFDQEREEECGICLVPTTKMVLPGCCHAMCINCYRNWNTRSESCPFCRRGLRRVKSEDLWVLTSESEVIDTETVSREELSRFYLYIQSLPKDSNPDAPFWGYYDYLI
ncbi:E3 ubiquitin-protein ligase AIRP2 [Beta vulgaris subsp. vulgaris]|uniref:E3 ubiquitin-protein ligase AIRP2 n=1 Tax=Beta vulgaris subsp. vulgaris TaxID=3555 RepID=UPI0020366835|nr:E3 ubiquitin-protein ligase AIRP2 [Beta vulgaris subsp. vulgaris]